MMTCCRHCSGLESVLCNIRVNNDLGHPVCSNLRDGNWLMDYTSDRLVAAPNTTALGQWLKVSNR